MWRIVLRYGPAVLMVAVAFGATSLLLHVRDTPFVFPFFAAVALSAWMGGARPGWLAVALSTVAVKYFFVPPFYSFAINRGDVPLLIFFVVCAVAAHALSVFRRRAEQSLRQTRDHLEASVEERTAELQRTNDALRAEITRRQGAEDALRLVADVAAAASAATDTPALMAACLHKICALRQWPLGQAWLPGLSPDVLVCSAGSFVGDADCAEFRSLSVATRLTRGQDLPGQVWESHQPTWVTDVTAGVAGARLGAARAAGLHGALAFPVIVDQEVLAVFEFLTRDTRPPDQALLDAFRILGPRLGGFWQRMRTEESLRRSEASLAEGQRLTHTASCVWNVRSGEVLWSQEGYRIFAFDPEKTVMLYEIASERVHPEDHPSLVRSVTAAVREGRAFENEYRIVLLDGSVKHLRSVGHPVVPESGAIVEYIGTIMDITERKRAEAALLEQASLLDLTHDTIFVRDMADVITYWNSGAEALYGWTKEEAVGTSSHSLMQTIFPAPLEQINAELLRSGRWEGELVHTKRNGARVVVASRWSLQRDGQGRPATILETNNDITERRRAELALREAQAELAHVTRVMTMAEMAASIAHEINQPLAAVVTNGGACLRWLASDPPNLEEAREAVTRIIQDGNRASEVITRIRGFLTKSPLEMIPLHINDVVGEVIALVQPEAARRQVSLRNSFTDGLPPARGDRVQLQQVLVNLIMNGVDAMASLSARPRELRLRTERHESGGVLVAVQDSGIGLDPQTKDKLFDAFFTTKSAGMGMGLSISRSIVEAHGGQLWATQNDGPGATFQFTLPGMQ